MAKEEEKKGEGGEKEIEREDVEEQLKKIKEEVLRERERRTQQKKNDSPWVGVIFVVYCLGLLGVCWWLGGVLEREGWFVEMGGGGGGGERKTDDKRYQLQVPLEDVFKFVFFLFVCLLFVVCCSSFFFESKLSLFFFHIFVLITLKSIINPTFPFSQPRNSLFRSRKSRNL